MLDRKVCRQAGGGQGGRDRTHFQTGLQVFRIDGGTGAGPERQGSYANHGKLWDRHRADSYSIGGAIERCKWILVAGSIAPFTVVVTVTNVADAALKDAGEKLAAELEAAGLDVLLDDRDERAGVKFKDADLVGIPTGSMWARRQRADRWNWSRAPREPVWTLRWLMLSRR